MPQLRTSDYETLLHIMRQENDALNSLQATLLQEKEALENDDINTVTTIAEHKSSQLESLAPLIQQRSDLLKAADIENTPDSLEQAFQKAPTEQLRNELADILTQNISILESCKKQNEINGVVIEVGRQGAEFVLDLLQTPAKEPTSTTYNKKGKTSQSNGKPPLAKA